MNSFKKNSWLCLDFGLMPYERAWAWQHKLVALRQERRLDVDVLIILEHPPVFTLGRRGGRNHLKVSEKELKSAKIPLVQVERGGEVTYHGPGQLIGYPIIDLRKARLGVVEYVTKLEEVMIRLAAAWRISAGRNALNRGVWVGQRKLGSVGIAVRHGISFHGFALNVNTALEPFEWIDPCGLEGVAVTSLARELSRKVFMPRMRAAVKQHMASVFNVRVVETAPDDLAALIGPVEPFQMGVPPQGGERAGFS